MKPLEIEQVEMMTLQPTMPEAVAAAPGIVPTNPSSLTLALIGIGTFALLGLGRRTRAQRLAIRPTSGSPTRQSTEKRAA